METGFFKWLWRFNGIVIAVCSLAVLALIIWESTSQIRRDAFPTRTTNTVALPAAPDAQGNTTSPKEISRSFGSPVGNGRGPLYALPLYVEQEYPNRGIHKSSGGNIVNYRIIETQEQTNRWLFAPRDRLITETSTLQLRPRAGGLRSIGYLLTVIEEDTNGDARLSERDTKTLYLTSLAWEAPRKITQGVIRVLAQNPLSETELDLIFTTADGTHVTRIEVPSATLLSEQVIGVHDGATAFQE